MRRERRPRHPPATCCAAFTRAASSCAWATSAAFSSFGAAATVLPNAFCSARRFSNSPIAARRVASAASASSTRSTDAPRASCERANGIRIVAQQLGVDHRGQSTLAGSAARSRTSLETWPPRLRRRRRLPRWSTTPIKVNLKTLKATVKAAESQAGWNKTLWFETSVLDPGGDVASRLSTRAPTWCIAAGGDGTVRAVAEALRGTERAARAAAVRHRQPAGPQHGAQLSTT